MKTDDIKAELNALTQEQQADLLCLAVIDYMAETDTLELKTAMLDLQAAKEMHEQHINEAQDIGG